MKLKRNMLKIMVIAVIPVMAACTSTSKKSNTELKEEVTDVKQELNEIAQNEKAELKAEVDSMVNDFNLQMAALENKIEEGEMQLNEEAENLLQGLKAERDSLKRKAEEIELQTEKDWEEFRNELEHDVIKFKEGVGTFFEDNVKEQ